MNNYLNRPIDLDRVQAELDTSASALNTLSYLLDANADRLKSDARFDPEEFSYGIASLLAMLANTLHINSSHISELHDQLRHEGVRP
ncbi:hypothetical protein [Aeromonas bivalvium]|uniref:hypothetical protein n=1 Tax=Aeromonas bivalvium TaxID=440079 RepID=UPI0038D242FA